MVERRLEKVRHNADAMHSELNALQKKVDQEFKQFSDQASALQQIKIDHARLLGREEVRGTRLLKPPLGEP
jgi:uncharacterized coiled-coil DUF342 family protein